MQVLRPPREVEREGGAPRLLLVAPIGQDYQSVVTLNGWTLPLRMNGEWKEFHLVAEPVTCEIAPA